MDDEKPVIALMGEFSAGKSTLANLLIGEGVSPVKVTATQLPPVWYSYGEGNPIVVTVDGDETEITPEEFEEVDVETTAFIRVFVEADMLQLMDIMDMPGNSDPNMSADVWARSIHFADGVIWCSHANQAWRQSEAAVWDEMPEDLYANSVLLLTRFDKIREERDGQRIVRRVQSEAKGLFAGIFPVSLLLAQSAEEDRGAWQKSGVEPFLECLLDIVMRGGADLRAVSGEDADETPAEAPDEPDVTVVPRRVQTSKDDGSQRQRRRPVA